MTTQRALWILNICLAVGLAWLWVDETGQSRPQTWAAPVALGAGVAARADSMAAHSLANPLQYVAILDRPLFAPNRRPPPIPESPALAPPPSPDVLASLRVVGLYEAEGASGLLGRVDGKTRRVSLGGVIDGWTLAEIQGREAVFRQGADERRIKLVPMAQERPDQQPQATVSPAAARPAAQLFHDVERERQEREEATRENTRRQNEIRAKAGLSPIRD